MTSVPPLFLDIDGTITRPEGGLEPRIIDPLRTWNAPVIFATGKAFPYPIALCQFLALPERVVAENGGIVCVDDQLELMVDSERLGAFKVAASEDGLDLTWGATETVNRWRETEIAVDRNAIDRSTLGALASSHDLEVVDSGYAYHVKDPGVDKGSALRRASDLLAIDPTEAVAIGDSENDVSMFELAGRSVALGNADSMATEVADRVTSGTYADGTLDILTELAGR